MNNILFYAVRVIMELLIFVGIYYFLMTRWQKKPRRETFRKSIIMGLIWVIVYEIIIYFFV